MKSWWYRGAVLAAVLLPVTFGFCILPGHHGDLGNHGTSPDLCASLFILLVSPVLLTGPAINGWLLSVRRVALHVVPPLLVDRPPEFLLTA